MVFTVDHSKAFDVIVDGEELDLAYMSKLCIMISRHNLQISEQRDPGVTVESVQCFLAHTFRADIENNEDLPLIEMNICGVANPNALWTTSSCTGYHEIDQFVFETD